MPRQESLIVADQDKKVEKSPIDKDAASLLNSSESSEGEDLVA